MTKKLTIEFLQFNKPKRNGDRAMYDTDCYNFEIKLNGMILHMFTQYNPWWESVGNYDPVLREATKYAEDLADTLEIARPKLVTMVQKETHTIEWVPGVTPKACHHADHLKDPKPQPTAEMQRKYVDKNGDMWATALNSKHPIEEARKVSDELREKGHRENRDNG